MISYTLTACSAIRAVLTLTGAVLDVLLVVWAFVIGTFRVHLFILFYTVFSVKEV